MSLYALFMFQAASVGVVLWLFFGLYKEYRVDKLRHQLFQIRDGLFDKAMAGDIEFNHSAYGITRITLNGMIRFAHELSFYRVFTIYMISKFYKHTDSGYGEAMKRAMNRLDDSGQTMITDIHTQAYTAVLIHMAHTSIVFGPVLLVVKALKEITRPFLAAVRLFGRVAGLAAMIADYIIITAINHAPVIRLDIEAQAYERGKLQHA